MGSWNGTMMPSRPRRIDPQPVIVSNQDCGSLVITAAEDDVPRWLCGWCVPLPLHSRPDVRSPAHNQFTLRRIRPV